MRRRDGMLARCGLALMAAWIAGVPPVLAQPAPMSQPAHPVRYVVEERLTVSGSAGEGQLPVALSADWTRPLPRVTRAVIMLHGTARNADTYLRLLEQTRATADAPTEGTLLVAPQFLTDTDAETHQLSTAILRWDADGWIEAEPALGPVGLSSFDAFDSLLARLANPDLFPALRQVVMAGHAVGAGMLQRYAVVGRGEAALSTRGIGIRYVVANPPSYLWFGEDRPNPVDRSVCADFDRWSMGFRGTPPYVGDLRGMERRYIAKDVVYLLGEADRDPSHPTLDRSCGAMAQGDNRFTRGMHYMFALEVRRPNLVRNRVFALPDVGHDAAVVYTSNCGLAALFGREGCVGLAD